MKIFAIGIAFTQAVLNLHLTGKIRNNLYLLGVRIKMVRGESWVFVLDRAKTSKWFENIFDEFRTKPL